MTSNEQRGLEAAKKAFYREMDAGLGVEAAIAAYLEATATPPSSQMLATLQRIADEISSLKLHPTTSEEYDAGYIGARNDAFSIIVEAIDEAPVSPIASFAERAAYLVKRSPPDFADKDQHVEWGGDAFVLLEEIAALSTATPETKP